jgi:perosamine synthetase
MDIKYPVYRPSLDGNEKRYVNECLDTGWISSRGSFVTRFEERFAEYVGCKYATSVCNGTVALHLALVALGIGPDDEVIVPTFTYIASVNAITYTGARPVFAESRADTWQLDPEDVRKRITPRTRAIMPVHLYGHPCDMDAFREMAEEHGLFLVEDCAEAFGSLWKGGQVGTFGHVGCFSFFGNKTITTGEGGMVVTDDETLHERLVHFKGQGLAKYREYWHDVVGYNYRMTNVEAAIGLAQLERAEETIARKIELAGWYREELQGVKSLSFHDTQPGVRHTHWMVTVLVADPRDRDPLREHLRQAGIETRPTFYPVHRMPPYADRFQRLPVAENLGWRGMNLPSYPGLTRSDVAFICERLRAYFQ